MPLPSSGLSRVGNHIAEFLRTGLDAATNNVSVLVGAPGNVNTNADFHQVNLFFYRFEPSGFQSDVRPGDVWRLRLFCLVTPFGVDEDDNGNTIGAGENELRLMGETIRLFHEMPILAPLVVGGETVRMQAAFLPPTDEQLNQIWSTQGDAAYRPSAVYEFSLSPVVPSVRRAPARLAGALGMEARGQIDRAATFNGVAIGPPVSARHVDIVDPAWRPAAAWVQNGDLFRSLAFEDGSVELAAFDPVTFWLAGDPTASVDLIWERWTPTGWTSIGTPIPVHPYGTAIDPDALPDDPGSFPQTTPLPLTALPSGESSEQLLLYARRRFVRYSGGPEETVRSEPLLITIFAGSP